MSGVESVTLEFIVLSYFIMNKLTLDSSFYKNSSAVDDPNKESKQKSTAMN